jgi:hypothetical protein
VGEDAGSADVNAKPEKAPMQQERERDVQQAPAAIRALMRNIIDYAGLFPPAKLDMAPTVRNYSEYLRGDDAWMLGRLIVPVSRLDEFEQHARELLPQDDDEEPWQISALTAPAGEAKLAADFARIEAFNETHQDRRQGLAQIDVVELAADSTSKIEMALDALPDDLFAYFELPVADDPRGLIAALAGADAGAKVRTGGVEPGSSPSPADLARFIAAAAGANVPFKATAGLHHPLRHRNDAVGAEEFGFLNVFIAACLADQQDLSIDELQRVLVETSNEAFAISGGAIGWRKLVLTTEQIDRARENFAVSFGSCSFDEPRDDLRSLKLL